MATITIHIPRANQGQIVEVGYGWTENGRLYRRIVDQSLPIDQQTEWQEARDSKAFRRYRDVESESVGLWDEPPPERITWKNCEDPTK